MQAEGIPNDWLTVTEVAQLLRVSRTSVVRYIREGQLRAIQVGRLYRVTPLDLAWYLAQRETMPPRVVR